MLIYFAQVLTIWQHLLVLRKFQTTEKNFIRVYIYDALMILLLLMMLMIMVHGVTWWMSVHCSIILETSYEWSDNACSLTACTCTLQCLFLWYPRRIAITLHAGLFYSLTVKWFYLTLYRHQRRRIGSLLCISHRSWRRKQLTVPQLLNPRPRQPRQQSLTLPPHSPSYYHLVLPSSLSDCHPVRSPILKSCLGISHLLHPRHILVCQPQLLSHSLELCLSIRLAMQKLCLILRTYG